MGRPVSGTSGPGRDVSIPFGRSGYVARYAYVGHEVEILAVRQMREAGFKIEHQGVFPFQISRPQRRIRYTAKRIQRAFLQALT